MKLGWIICLMSICTRGCINAPLDPNIAPGSGLSKVKVLDFLKEKGYLRTFSEIGEAQADLTAAIKRFQEFAGIAQTGRLDEETQEYMIKPRCGMPDINEGETSYRRKKRYTLHGSVWRDVSDITWALENSNNDGITDRQVRDVMKRSFDKWSVRSQLRFRELVGQPIDSADIRVRFERGQHSDQYAFDGRGGTLAHAFYPQNNEGLSGDVHFDDDEIYTVENDSDRSKRKLLWVSVHELGHSIGLRHSSLKGAVMYPWYQHFEGDDFDLTEDDILGLQKMYGSNPSPTANTRATTTIKKPETTNATPVPSKCISEMKAVFLGSDGDPFIINNNIIYILNRKSPGVSRGPINVNQYFATLNDVDAVFRRQRDSALVFFHGDKFTVYEKRSLLHAARKISDGFQGLSDGFSNIDAAFVYSENNKLYLFRGEKYWRFTQLRSYDYLLDGGYPQAIATGWYGVPNSIDAAFQWNNGKLYFVKDNAYYRWDNRLNQVHSGYPVKNTRSFLACTSEPGQLRDESDIGSSSALHSPLQNIFYALIIIFYYALFL